MKLVLLLARFDLYSRVQSKSRYRNWHSDCRKAKNGGQALPVLIRSRTTTKTFSLYGHSLKKRPCNNLLSRKNHNLFWFGARALRMFVLICCWHLFVAAELYWRSHATCDANFSVQIRSSTTIQAFQPLCLTVTAHPLWMFVYHFRFGGTVCLKLRNLWCKSYAL